MPSRSCPNSIATGREPGSPRPEWIKNPWCWPTTSAGFCGSRIKTKPVARLVGEAEAILEQRIIADPASTGNAVIVVTADRRVRALAARDLSPVGSWALDAPLAGPPIGVDETCAS